LSLIRGRKDELSHSADLARADIAIKGNGQGRAFRPVAISTCIDPEVLLLDEAVGAGDAAFLLKAKHRLDAVVARAGILVVASHSEALVRRLCAARIPAAAPMRPRRAGRHPVSRHPIAAGPAFPSSRSSTTCRVSV
jgi:hypothetical protein